VWKYLVRYSESVRKEVKEEEVVHWKVDIREPDNLIDYFKRELNASEVKLESGDYVYDDIVAFERKSKDFLNFALMLDEVNRMVELYPYAYLVTDLSLTDIIKHSQEYYHKNMISNILGVIASLSVRGCPPIFCDSQTMMINVMRSIAEKSLDGKNRGKPALKSLTSIDPAVNILRGLGVGTTKAEAISAEYKGDGRQILTVILNTPYELAKVEGVGEGTIDKILESMSPGKVTRVSLDDGDKTSNREVSSEDPF
jgi:ERCC4-type nuclease